MLHHEAADGGYDEEAELLANAGGDSAGRRAAAGEQRAGSRSASATVR